MRGRFSRRAARANIERLLDWRTPEERRLAVVKFDPEWARVQALLAANKVSPWERLRKEAGL
jgi:hypothetical protein